MGANFQTMTLPGTTSRDEVTKTFSKVQDRDRSQNDSQYAGGFGMCSGLILTDYNFHIRRTAEAYLVGRSQKWGHALAVSSISTAFAPDPFNSIRRSQSVLRKRAGASRSLIRS
jgi:hypothetical protein